MNTIPPPKIEFEVQPDQKFTWDVCFIVLEHVQIGTLERRSHREIDLVLGLGPTRTRFVLNTGSRPVSIMKAALIIQGWLGGTQARIGQASQGRD